MDEEEIILPDNIVLVYDWLPYTYHRIMRMLKEIDCEAVNIYQGYKANRNPNYCELYRIIRITDGKVIHPCINLYSLQKFFAHQGFPLYDEKSACNQSKRNKGAEAFLKAVKSLSDTQESEKEIF